MERKATTHIQKIWRGFLVRKTNTHLHNYSVMFHRRYVDGTPRPLLRGWLHGCALAVVLSMLVTHWTHIRIEVLPTILAITWTLMFSALLHLYSWRSLQFENYAYRLDRVGIIWITMASIGLAPIMVDSTRCRPPLAFTIVTNFVPNMLSAATVLNDSRSPKFIMSVVFANVACAMHWATIDSRFVLMSVTICGTYCIGFWFYMSRFSFGRPVHAEYWGYHEHMHVFITLAFVMHVAAIDFFVKECTAY